MTGKGCFGHALRGLAAGLAVLGLGFVPGAGTVQAKDTVKMGLVAFISGPAAGVFGIPARTGAEVVIDALNAGEMAAPYDTPGIAGAMIAPIGPEYVHPYGCPPV